MSRHATYEIVNQAFDHLVIRDVGYHDRQLTVTNDAEWVVEQLELRVGRGNRLFYYDTEGKLDELLIDWQKREGVGGTYWKGVFAGFKHCPVDHHRDLPAFLEREHCA